jgi:translocator protein
MNLQNSKSPWLEKFLPCLLLCLGGGWLTGLLTEHGVKHWYPHLIKPSGTPPDIVFPVVWTILYTLMAISLTLLWTSKSPQKKTALLFFGIQLFLNFIWSWLFFYLQHPGFALIDIFMLWFFIFMTIVSFWRHTILGSYLLMPYLVWVTYAAYLNFFIWLYN